MTDIASVIERINAATSTGEIANIVGEFSAAEIKTGDRRVIKYILSPIELREYWTNC